MELEVIDIALLCRDDPDKILNGLGTYNREITKALEARGHNVNWFIGGTDSDTLKLGSTILEGFDLVYCVSLPYGARVKLPMVSKSNSPLKEEARYYSGFKRLKGFIGQYYEIATAKKSRAVISVSQTTHDILLNEYNIQSTVIPDGVDLEVFRPDKDEGKPLIARPRRNDPRKNMEAVRMAEDYIGDRATWVIEPQKADIFFAPSFSEGFDISLLEAMASGCACLASDIPAHRELVRQGVDGYLFQNEHDMKKILDMLIESKELRSMLGAFARVKAEQYPWSRSAEMLEKVFEGALSN